LLRRFAPPKKQLDPWSKDVGAVPRTARQARSGIGPYEIKGVSFIDNPDPKSGSVARNDLFGRDRLFVSLSPTPEA